MGCEITWHLAITCALEEFQNSEGTNVIFKKKSIFKRTSTGQIKYFSLEVVIKFLYEISYWEA